MKVKIGLCFMTTSFIFFLEIINVGLEQGPFDLFSFLGTASERLAW